jgi:hypothetical protein
MHFLILLLIILSGTYVLCFALVKAIGDFSKMSIHALPDIAAMPHGRVLEPEREHADAAESNEWTQLERTKGRSGTFPPQERNRTD